MRDAIEQAHYLMHMLEKSRDSIYTHSLNMAEASILVGRPIGPCLTCFDNLDRICSELIIILEKEKNEVQ